MVYVFHVELAAPFGNFNNKKGVLCISHDYNGDTRFGCFAVWYKTVPEFLVHKCRGKKICAIVDRGT